MPKPIWWVMHPSLSSTAELVAGGDLLTHMLRNYRSDVHNFLGACRCVSIDRLETILATGIDVVPSNSKVYIAMDGMIKAYEFGGTRKVMMVFNQDKVEKYMDSEHPYEFHIPGDAKSALKSMFIICETSDEDNVRGILEQNSDILNNRNK